MGRERPATGPRPYGLGQYQDVGADCADFRGGRTGHLGHPHHPSQDSILRRLPSCVLEGDLWVEALVVVAGVEEDEARSNFAGAADYRRLGMDTEVEEGIVSNLDNQLGDQRLDQIEALLSRHSEKELKMTLA